MQKRSGFTLLEVTLVVGILAIILSITIGIAFNAIGRSALRSTENIIIQGVRRAQTKSQQNIGDSVHGVYIDEGNAIYVFSGASFSSRSTAHDQVFQINENLTFSGALYFKMIDTPPAPDGAGLVFTRFTGEPSPTTFTGTIIINSAEDSLELTVNEKGVIER